MKVSGSLYSLRKSSKSFLKMKFQTALFLILFNLNLQKDLIMYLFQIKAKTLHYMNPIKTLSGA